MKSLVSKKKRPKLKPEWTDGALLGLLAVILLLFTLVGCYTVYVRDFENNSYYCNRHPKAEEHKYEKECQSEFYRAVDDPIVILTGFLDLFTIVLAGVTAWLVGVTRAGMRDQARDMQVSLRYAANSSEAATKAAKAALDTLASERAWLCFREHVGLNGTNIYEESTGITHDKGVGVVVNFINTGRSPASDIRLAYEAMLVPSKQDSVPVFTTPYDMSQGSFVVGPGQLVATRPMWIYGEKYDKFVEGKLRAIVYVRVQYMSVAASKNTFETEVCIGIMCNGTQEGSGGQGSLLNLEGSPVGRQNRYT